MTSQGYISPPEIWAAETIIRLIQEGNLPPWAKSWSMRANSNPRNLLRADKGYSGLNYMVTRMVGDMYGSPFFVTPKQLFELGGRKKEGERTWPVFFWSQTSKKDAETGEVSKGWFCKGYKVYNVTQTVGIESRIPAQSEPATYDHDPIPECEALADGYACKPQVIVQGQQPCYRPSEDRIYMPEANRFTTREEYYSTLFHEYAHSTGHESRLNRESGKTFGNHSYSLEELVAELTAAMVCGRAGIATRTIENSAAYVKSWLKVLDPKMMVHATRAARKAYALIVPSAAELETSNQEAA